MKLVEIFSSIQGEGAHLGMPCVFIRTQGCNLHCDFCDTKESWGNKAKLDMSVGDIVKEVQKYNVPLVVITGGEPCIQPTLQDLVDQLSIRGYAVAIETNGTQETPQGAWITCSPKEEADYKISPFCKPNELKYVVTSTFDAEKAIPSGIRKLYAGNIWLQPEGSDMMNMWKKCMLIAEADPRLRVGVQLHKIMEVK